MAVVGAPLFCLSLALGLFGSPCLSLFLCPSRSLPFVFFSPALSRPLSQYTLGLYRFLSPCASPSYCRSLAGTRSPFLIQLSHVRAHAFDVSQLPRLRARTVVFAIGVGWRRSWAGRRNAPGASRPRTSFLRRTRIAASPWRTASRRSALCARRENRAPSTTR